MEKDLFVVITVKVPEALDILKKKTKTKKFWGKVTNTGESGLGNVGFVRINVVRVKSEMYFLVTEAIVQWPRARNRKWANMC